MLDFGVENLQERDIKGIKTKKIFWKNSIVCILSEIPLLNL